jgi:hypothetical protein
MPLCLAEHTFIVKIFEKIFAKYGRRQYGRSNAEKYHKHNGSNDSLALHRLVKKIGRRNHPSS